MRWPFRLGWLIVLGPLMAASCRLYKEELQSSYTTDNRVRDAGVSIPDVQCGDGKITGTEKCDTGIPRGAAGACPTECPALASCAPRALSGTACQAECELLAVGCGPRDQCCPADCMAGSDADCSDACGDGIVDAERGETCEANSESPCPTSNKDCADDDPCTTDRVIGSARNCSALCVHMPISMRKADDGCCPAGADWMQDSDCRMPPGAAGDSDAGPPDAFCGADQPLTDCQRCSCERCLETYLDCRQGASATENELCSAVLECAERARCTGDACYCGSAPTIPPCLIPSGPCKQEIEKAAGTTDADKIRELTRDLRTPLGRATAAGTCRVDECNGRCFRARDPIAEM